MHAGMQFKVVLYIFLCSKNLGEQQSVTATRETLKRGEKGELLQQDA